MADSVAKGEETFQQSSVQAAAGLYTCTRLYTAALLSAPYGHTPLHDILMLFKHGCAQLSTPTYIPALRCPCFKAHCHPHTVNLYKV